jgi:hypothetical protein
MKTKGEIIVTSISSILFGMMLGVALCSFIEKCRSNKEVTKEQYIEVKKYVDLKIEELNK